MKCTVDVIYSETITLTKKINAFECSRLHFGLYVYFINFGKFFFSFGSVIWLAVL